MKKATTFSIALVFLLSACTNKPKYFFDEGEIFHTYYHIKYESEQNLSDTIVAELNKFNASLNPFLENSIIYNVNNNVDVEVDTFFIRVFSRSEEIAHFTDGMFDITCAPLINLWGFGFENIGKVDSSTVDSLLNFVGYQKVRLIGNRIQKDDPRLKLNMSAIAKGYAVDVVCNLLERVGVENYMCEIGGEIRTKGVNPSGETWLIGINKPIDDNTGTVSEIQAKLPLDNMAMATSGNYRNFYYSEDGKKYAHTINPKTGYPAEQNILSATVITNDCMTADALATAFMTMGLEKSKVLLYKLPDVMAYLIYSDEMGNISEYSTENIKKIIIEK